MNQSDLVLENALKPITPADEVFLMVEQPHRSMGMDNIQQLFWFIRFRKRAQRNSYVLNFKNKNILSGKCPCMHSACPNNVAYLLQAYLNNTILA